MLVECIANNISGLKIDEVRNRIRQWTDANGSYNDIEIGTQYLVQAVEYQRENAFYYLQVGEFDEYPYPYAAECFVVLDSSLPNEWVASTSVELQVSKPIIISFREWANDATFFEKLIDGEPEQRSIYSRNRAVR